MAKLTLKQMILNKIDDAPRGYAEELAQVSFYSNGSNLKKVLKTEDKEFDKFHGLVELVRYLFGEDEQKLMEQYSKEIDPNNKTARIMLEYLCNNRCLDSMRLLIERMNDCKNKESREWSKVYSIQLDWQINYHTLNVNDFLDSLKEVKTPYNELKIYIKVLRCYGYYLKKIHTMAYELSNEIIEEVKEIKDEYLRSIFEVKLNEILSYIHLRVRNNPNEARIKAESVLGAHIGLTHKAYAHYTIGCSYFYESYDKAMENFKKSIEIYEKINRDSAAKDIKEISELLDVVWDKPIPDVYINEQYRMYWILKNNMNFTLDINKDEIDATYYYLLKGMEENNTEILMQSMIHFLKKGDSFFGNLPKLELLKRGYSQVIIDELANIYSA